MILSILIPTLPKRSAMFNALLSQLEQQCAGRPIQILYDEDAHSSIGTKRNNLLQSAIGEYVCFIDDDDVIADDYITLIMGKIEGEEKPDCCSLRGVFTTNGDNPVQFMHSIKYTSYFEKDGVLYRCPNHLNVIKAEIAKQFDFINSSFGEDTDWAMRICKSGLLKTEAEIDDTLYYYRFLTKK